MSRWPWFAGLVVLVGAGLLVAARADAHGPEPRARFVVADDDAPLVVGTNVFGYFVSSDGGNSFGWICPDLFSSSDNVTSFAPRALFVAGERSLFVVGSAGMFRSDDGGCSWASVDAFGGLRIGHASVDPRDRDRIVAGTADGGVERNAIFASDDGGRTWERLPVDAAGLVTSVLVHPSSGRVYALASSTSARLLVSDDDGRTWTSAALPPLPGRVLSIAGVDPADDRTVFIEASRADHDLLLRTADAGVSTEIVLDRGDELFDLLFGEDGTLFIGRSAGGAWTSSDGGRTWDSGPTDPGMTCFAGGAERLFACGRDLGDAAAVMSSPDGGASWEPFFTYTQSSGPLACLGADEAATCDASRWQQQCAELAEWGVQVDRIASCGEPETPAAAGPDGCRVGTAVPGPFGGCAWLLLVVCKRRRPPR